MRLVSKSIKFLFAQQLPQDLQKEVRKSNIPIENLKGSNLKILLHVIRFTKKRDFRFSYPYDQKISRREISIAVIKTASMIHFVLMLIK